MTPLPVSLGDIVEVYCDHKQSGRRVRDWVQGVVVHADDRMTAIQFRNDVYLTDGWMVPDRILWFNKGSTKIRLKKKSRAVSSAKRKKPAAKKSRASSSVKRKKSVSSKRKKKAAEPRRHRAVHRSLRRVKKEKSKRKK